MQSELPTLWFIHDALHAFNIQRQQPAIFGKDFVQPLCMAGVTGHS